MGNFCPTCKTLLSKCWRGFFCRVCGYLDPTRDPWHGRVSFVFTTAGLAFSSLGRVVSETRARPTMDWPYWDPRRTFDVVSKHFPRYVWNSSPRVRAEYLETLSRLETPQPSSSRGVSGQISESLSDARDQALVDLKTALYGRKGASLGFDPMVDGPFPEIYSSAAEVLDRALLRLSARYPNAVLCQYCGLVVCGQELHVREFCNGDSCVDCLGIRQTYASSFDEALANISHRGSKK